MSCRTEKETSYQEKQNPLYRVGSFPHWKMIIGDRLTTKAGEFPASSASFEAYRRLSRTVPSTPQGGIPAEPWTIEDRSSKGGSRRSRNLKHDISDHGQSSCAEQGRGCDFDGRASLGLQSAWACPAPCFCPDLQLHDQCRPPYVRNQRHWLR